MKLVDQVNEFGLPGDALATGGNKLAIPRIANASSKRKRDECPQYGMKIPIYQGRYPCSCPGCGQGLENGSVGPFMKPADKINKLLK